VSHQPPHPLSLSLQDKNVYQPLPAQEQLDLLFHLAGIAPPGTTQTDTSLNISPQTLHEAYQTCKHITRHHSKSFFFSTQFLPADKRKHVYALYAFCRTSDDTVDMATEDPARALADWVHLARTAPPHDNPVLLAWHDTHTRYNLPQATIDELLAGVAMDLTISRYSTFDDLWLYCYRVASVVGLLSIGILGTASGAEPYAIKLGVALQLTNILRDVGEDSHRGRVYLPEEDLQQFGLTADDILAHRYNEQFCDLMRFEIERAHRLYDESWHGISLLPADSRLAVGVAARVYRGILDKIVMNEYDVFSQRAHLTLWEKLKGMPGIWQDVRQLGKAG